MTEPGRAVVRALEPFAVYVDGVPVQVGAGDLFYADDPVVKGRESMFGEIKVRTSEQPKSRGTRRPAAAVETATAAPGEKRATRRAAKGGTDDGTS